MMNLPSPSDMRLLRLTGLAGALCASAVMLATLAGCPEEPKPEPVPEYVPPPPPPPSADFNSLITDPRIQVAESVSSPEEAIARPVVTLVEAIAKGDDAALGSVLSAPAQAVLESMAVDGSWAEATGDIEAVRIVAAGDNLAPPPPPPGKWGSLIPLLDGGTIDDNVPEDIEKKVQDIFWIDLPKEPDFVEWVKENQSQWWAALDRDSRNMTDSGTLTLFKKGLDESKLLSQYQQKIKEALGAHYHPSTGEVRRYSVLLAVQKPAGAQLMAWDGVEVEGKGWVFTNIPVNTTVRPRASDFDGVGDKGFVSGDLVKVEQAGEAPKDAEELKSQAPEQSAPEGEKKDESDKPAEEGPKKKNTPGGPITIPGT